MNEVHAPADQPSPSDVSDCGGIWDPDRLQALADTGLGAAADPVMDGFAVRVRQLLDVPVALVSLVQADRQVFPGMRGLRGPWAEQRSTPLSHSFCQHVVATAVPLVIEDARRHDLVNTNAAVPELGVVAYAGMPLTDDLGSVLGSLCAIDSRPRSWSGEQLHLLRDLAAACSTELRLRLAKVDADRERRRRDELDARLRRAYARSQTLLLASEAFVGAMSVEAVREQIGVLVGSDLQPTYVGLTLLDDEQWLNRLGDPLFDSDDHDSAPWVRFGIDAALPSATAVREDRIVHYPDRARFDAAHPEPVRRLLARLGLEAVAAAPLPGPDGPVGSFILGWESAHELDQQDLITITTIAGYAAQALARARGRHVERQAAAQTRRLSETLQDSMLTRPFEPDHLQLAVRYSAAAADAHVGGDWYDAFTARDGALCVVIGDVAGHDRDAAAAMGQLRNLLRGITYAVHETPAGLLSRLDGAMAHLAIGVVATALVGRIEQAPADAVPGSQRLRWSNAGHPPPLRIGADGVAQLLDTRPDLLLGVDRGTRRADHVVDIAPGDTVLLYTDGLVERRGVDLDESFDWLLGAVAAHVHRPLEELCDALLREVGRTEDDIALLALRAHPEGRPCRRGR